MEGQNTVWDTLEELVEGRALENHVDFADVRARRRHGLCSQPPQFATEKLYQNNFFRYSLDRLPLQEVTLFLLVYSS